MRIVTRGDFDGLGSSVLLSEILPIREIRFVHPKDVQDGKVKADAEDIVVNVPYIPGCGLWFDHHVSEEEKVPQLGDFKGRFAQAPSCARVIYDYFQTEHKEKLARFAELLAAVDKLDSANLTREEVDKPAGWILLGLTLDPRSGLGPEFQKYFRWLVEYIKEVPLAKVLQHQEVKKRCDRVLKEQEEFKKFLKKYARQEENVIFVDLRGQREKPVGNRFLVFTMFPEANVEVRLFDGHQGAVVVAVGHSIFNRTCEVNVGTLLSKYGGGGHRGAGTVQLSPAEADRAIQEIIAALKS